ncbi:MAG: YegS/Rv2252/BmrU family lipid kinase [Eubacterium sp.]|nr:YegS/Rv2252/BmrU family lipid kinase [Eubacterium sp.]
MSRKLLFVYNPLSGKGQIKNKLSDIVDLMVKNGYEVTIHPTQEKGDAYNQIVNMGEDYSLVVCSGGDGTLDETVTGMRESGKNLPIGYIPAGSTNDFANSLKIPKRIMTAAQTAVEGVEFSCDLAEFNGQTYVYVAAFGVLTDVSYATKQELKNVLGHAAYFVESAKRWHGLDEIAMRVEYEDKVIEDVFCYGMVSNSNYIAGVKTNFIKDVGLNDGKYEVVLIKTPKNPVQLNRILSGMINIKEETELIVCFKTDHVTFHTEEKLPWTLDGEFGGEHTDVTIDVISDGMKIKVKEIPHPVHPKNIPLLSARRGTSFPPSLKNILHLS